MPETVLPSLRKGVLIVKKLNLRSLIFLALCCDLGLVAKKVISPFANMITDSLHIPGGIGTGFSLMFLVIAVMLVPRFGCGTIFGAVQGILAVAFGMLGNMGALSPIGYILPGFAVDLLFYVLKRSGLSVSERMVLGNSLASVCAALAANCIVFHLWGVALLLYICVAACSGVLCGLLGSMIVKRVMPVLRSGNAGVYGDNQYEK